MTPPLPGAGGARRPPASRPAGRPNRREGRPGPLLRAFLAVAALLAATWDVAVLLRRARQGPWTVAIENRSMEPALRSGDWLLVDPTSARWPRRGTVVLVRAPGEDRLLAKRVAGRPGDTVRLADGSRRLLGPREAWVVGDAQDRSTDSRSFGPLDLDGLVARVTLRYAPLRRFGRV